MKLFSLCPEDGRMLDSLVERGAFGALAKTEAGQTDHAAQPHDAQRAAQFRDLGAVLDRCGVESVPDALVERTLARVRDTAQRQRFAQQVQVLGGSSPPGFQWGELATVAAVLLIGVSLLWPVMHRVRSDARRMACSANLSVAGQSFGRYASDHGGVMPRGKIEPGTVWWNVGAPSNADESFHSNSAHLYILVRSKYISAAALRCPDNPSGLDRMNASMHDWPTARSVSYSYQNQYANQAIRLDQLPEMAILADKNPLFVERSNDAEGLAYRGDMDPTSPSDFHARRGQNILTSSGRVMWSTQPIGPNGDNIWVIRGVHNYRGVETPRSADDSFLVP